MIARKYAAAATESSWFCTAERAVATCCETEPERQILPETVESLRWFLMPHEVVPEMRASRLAVAG